MTRRASGARASAGFASSTVLAALVTLATPLLGAPTWAFVVGGLVAYAWLASLLGAFFPEHARACGIAMVPGAFAGEVGSLALVHPHVFDESPVAQAALLASAVLCVPIAVGVAIGRNRALDRAIAARRRRG